MRVLEGGGSGRRGNDNVFLVGGMFWEMELPGVWGVGEDRGRRDVLYFGLYSTLSFFFS